MSKKEVCITVISHLLVCAVGIFGTFLIMHGHLQEPYEESAYYGYYTEFDTPTVMPERVIHPIQNFNAHRVHERMLYGEFVQFLGETMLGLNFLATEEFGPYTVMYVHGRPEEEVIRFGFYEVTDYGTVVLHLRFLETPCGELMLAPVTQTWALYVNYPFIQLSYGPYTLITTFHLNEEPLNVWDSNADTGSPSDNE